MNINLFYAVLIILYCFQSCSNTNFQGYSEIEFTDSTKSVTDSVIILEKLLKEIYKSNGQNFYINNFDELVINSITIGLWEKILIDPSLVINSEMLSGMDTGQKIRLIHLLSFLLKNKISGAYYNVRLNVYMFSYCQKEFSYFEHDYRNIVINRNKTYKQFEGYTILDEKGELLLIAPTRE